MPAPELHPLEARFIKLAIIEQYVKPSQLRQCQETWRQRVEDGEVVSLEQVLQQEGFITDDECERIWEQIAQSAGTNTRNALKRRKTGHATTGTKEGKSEAAPPSDEGQRLVPVDPASIEVPRPTDVPRHLAGFEITEWIGKGGMGKVYKARQMAMDRTVALKLLPPDLAKDAKYIRRFIREAHAAGMLNHGNLVRVYDVGEEDGRYFISMEYVEGRTVKQIMRREGRVPIGQSLHIVEQVAAALHCAHQHKIVHRDIKPDNIMITPKGVAKLCDLGLAKVLPGGPLQDSDTMDGHTLGTPHYMSPEQAKDGGKVDPRSDLFSLGATIYHMVTGEVPFDGETAWDVLTKVIHDPPRRPDRIEPLLPPPYTALIMRLLSKNPNERPQSAEEVRREVRNLREDLEAGRVFVFEDAPRPPLGRPLPGPAPEAPAVWKRWAAALGVAVVFLVCCAFVARSRARYSVPTPQLPQIAGTTREGSSPPVETTETQTTLAQAEPSEPAHPANPLPRPPRHDLTQLVTLDKQLEQAPQTWRPILTQLNVLAREVPDVTPEDRARYEQLRARVLKLRDAEAEQAFAARRDGAARLAQTGGHLQALRLLNELPPILRAAPGVEERLQTESTALRRAMATDAEARAAYINGMLENGLVHIAAQTLDDWRAELARDGARPNDERFATLEKTASRVKGALLENEADLLRLQKYLRGATAEVAKVRAMAEKHRFEEAHRQIATLIALAKNEVEGSIYRAEKMRLELVQGLLGHMAEVLNANPRRIHEEQFRNRRDMPKGMVVGMENEHLVVESRNGKARVGLHTLDTLEFINLLHQIFTVQKLGKDNVLGRLALDMGRPASQAARHKLADLASEDAHAGAFVRLLVDAERAMARAHAGNILDSAEEAVLKGDYRDAQLLVSMALETLGSAELPKLSDRAEALLRLAAARREQAALFSGAYRALSRGRARLSCASVDLAVARRDWPWKGAEPNLRPDGALGFGEKVSHAKARWTLGGGPARVMVEIEAPEQAEGGLVLTLEPLLEDPSQKNAWSLKVDAALAGVSAVLQGSGEHDPGWGKLKLTAGMRHRLTLEIQPGLVRWLHGSRVVETRAAPPSTGWRIGLAARGEVTVFGLEAEGQLTTGFKLDDRRARGEAAFERAQRVLGADRETALLDVLKVYGSHPELGSRICAELATFYGASGQGVQAREWSARALYAFPQRLWPEQTRALLDEHRRWQAFRESRGLWQAARPGWAADRDLSFAAEALQTPQAGATKRQREGEDHDKKDPKDGTDRLGDEEDEPVDGPAVVTPLTPDQMRRLVEDPDGRRTPDFKGPHIGITPPAGP